MKILDKKKLTKKFAFFSNQLFFQHCTVSELELSIFLPKSICSWSFKELLEIIRLMCFSGKPPTRQGKPGSVAADPLAQVQREIAILKKLNHPNVVKLVEVNRIRLLRLFTSSYESSFTNEIDHMLFAGFGWWNYWRLLIHGVRIHRTRVNT